MKHRPVIVAIALALAAALPLSVATAQPETPDLPLFLEVRAGGVPMVLKVVDGATGTIESAAGVKVGLISKVTSGGVEIHAFEIFSAPGFGEKAREVEIIDVGVGDTVRLTRTKLDLEVTLIQSPVPPVPPEWKTQAASARGGCTSVGGGTPSGFRIAGVAKVSSGRSQEGTLGPCSRCCVTCDGVTACWCEFWMSCGHCCCDGPACGPCSG